MRSIPVKGVFLRVANDTMVGLVETVAVDEVPVRSDTFFWDLARNLSEWDRSCSWVTWRRGNRDGRCGIPCSTTLRKTSNRNRFSTKSVSSVIFSSVRAFLVRHTSVCIVNVRLADVFGVEGPMNAKEAMTSQSSATL